MLQQLVLICASILMCFFISYVIHMLYEENALCIRRDFHGCENSGCGLLCHDTIAFRRLPVLQRTCCLHLHGRYEDGDSRFLQTTHNHLWESTWYHNLEDRSLPYAAYYHTCGNAMTFLCATLLYTVDISELKADSS